MDYFKNIKINFDFLRNYGFKRERFTNGIDNEVVYRKASFEIAILCGMAFSSNVVPGVECKNGYYVMNEEFDEKKFEEEINHSHMAVEVIIFDGYRRSNLFGSELFNGSQLQNLKLQIIGCNRSIEKIIEAYGNFFKDNLSKIITAQRK